jgi:hypothetical protein
MKPSHGHEQGAGNDLPGIVRNCRHLSIRQIAGQVRCPLKDVQEVF